MNSCGRLTDRMPEVAHARSAWTRLERDHLADCPACVLEWRFVQGAIAHGAAALSRFDHEAVAHRVALGWSTIAGRVPARPRRVVVRWAVGLAAAAALLLVVGSSELTVTAVPSLNTAALLPELRDLTETELETVLQEIPAGTTSLSLPLGAGMSDLDEAELERVLRSLEG